MSMTINIGQQPNYPGYAGGGFPAGMPGYGFPGGGFPSGGFPGGGMPGGPGGISLQIGEGGPGNGEEGGKCCGKKEKKDRGIIGDILTGIFGEDSAIGRMIDGRGKSRCHRGHHHKHCNGSGSGSTNININVNERNTNLGF